MSVSIVPETEVIKHRAADKLASYLCTGKFRSELLKTCTNEEWLDRQERLMLTLIQELYHWHEPAKCWNHPDVDVVPKTHWCYDCKKDIDDEFKKRKDAVVKKNAELAQR